MVTPGGQRGIETLRVGDRVLAEDPASGAVRPEAVATTIDDGVNPLVAMHPCYALRSGRHRAATWYDARPNVVWLLAAGLYRSGESDDFYAIVVGRERAGHLHPTAVDYEDHADDLRRDRLAQEATALRAIREEVLSTRRPLGQAARRRGDPA